jgi:hypothetical protein
MQDEFDQERGGQASDERKETRWNIPIPVTVRGTRADGTEFEEESITADASPSGMCLLLTVPLRRGSQVHIAAPEEGFESLATVTDTSTLGSNMNRIRVRFDESKKFGRQTAARRYVYDYASDSWIGYLFEGTYYNSKHEPFGRLEGPKIVSLETGKDLFVLRWGSFYDLRGNCLGHLV